MRKLRTSFAYNISQPEESTWIHPSETELVKDLRASGLDLYSIDILTNTSESYTEAIPVLIKHLYLMKDRLFLDGILRALTVKEARGIAFEPIYEMYIKDKDTKDHGAKYAMANALQYLAEKKDMPRIIELALDLNNGPTRFAFVDRIASSAGSKNIVDIKNVLSKLSNDVNKDIASRAQKALKRKKFL